MHPRNVRHLSAARRATEASVALVAALAIVLAPVTARAQPAPATPGAAAAPTTPTAAGEDDTLYSCKKARGSVTVSFKPETELKDLITWVMGFTCKNFIYDSSILSRSKKITIVSPVKMSAQEAYRTFLVSLSTMGLTVVPKGNVLRIVESGNAKSESVPLRRGTPGNADEVVRLVLRPNYLSLNELSNAINAVKSNVGAVQPVAEANALIVTDWASHARDMVNLVRELDRPIPSSNVYTIKVQYADAKEMATKLTEILNMAPGGGGGPKAPPGAPGAAAAAAGGDVASAVPAKIMADERTNTLLLLSNEAGYLRVRALVKRLDVAMDTEGADGSIHVYPLENATAEELAQTLNNALQGQGQQQRRGGQQPNVPQAPRQAPAAGGGDFGAAFEGQVRITHDAPTNSLVVVASGRDFVALSDVIRKLDISRRQVFIEAVILEVNLNNDLTVGSSFHGGAPVDGDEGAVIGGLQGTALRSTSIGTLAAASGLIGGLIGPELEGSKELLGTSIPSYAVLFQALAKSNNANLLSSPHIIASDNQESEISVGQNVPYVGGVTGIPGLGIPGAGGAAGGLSGLAQQSIQREKLNLTMKIKPHVNASDRVRLDIELEIKDLGGRDQQFGPIWNERKIKTSVVVPDQESVVIGGLISDKVSYSEEKIPFLGDIPILGYLFKQTTRSKNKSNLLVLLTPYVVRDHLDIESLVERKVRERNEFVRSFGNLDEMKYMPKADYRRKRGLIEEINRALITIEGEAAILRGFEGGASGVPEGRLDYDSLQQPDDDAPAPAAPATQPAPPASEPAPPADSAEPAKKPAALKAKKKKTKKTAATAPAGGQ